ncbi:hypothetical protein ACIF70_32475 [Actinacidiphila glaucinigra]|uniref:hypothetical protein n=1 Tax=Actinacidiphila glaucinigra TaxID=235986 RepID=UPI0037C5DF5F
MRRPRPRAGYRLVVTGTRAALHPVLLHHQHPGDFTSKAPAGDASEVLLLIQYPCQVRPVPAGPARSGWN